MNPIIKCFQCATFEYVQSKVLSMKQTTTKWTVNHT